MSKHTENKLRFRRKFAAKLIDKDLIPNNKTIIDKCIDETLMRTTSSRRDFMKLSMGLTSLMVLSPSMARAMIDTGLFDNPSVSFGGSFTNSLIPEFGSNVVFTRPAGTSNGTVRDYLGYFRECVAGEARFDGARRVYNKLTDSESFSTGWKIGADTYIYGGVTTINPFTNSANIKMLKRLSGSAAMLTLSALACPAQRHNFSIVIDWWQTSQNVSVSIIRNSDNRVAAQYSVPIVKRTVLRYSFPFTPLDATPHRIEITCAAAGYAKLEVASAQLEDVYGLPSDCCSDYVSSKVLSAPWHGAGVDQVKYFSNTNPWQYASGSYGLVNAKATASVLTTMLGLKLDPLTWNKCSYSDFTKISGFARYNVTTPTKQNSVFGPATLANLVSDGSMNTHYIERNWTSPDLPRNSSTSVTFSVYVRLGDWRWLAIEQHDGTSSLGIAYFDTVNKTVGTVTGVYGYAEIHDDNLAWNSKLLRLVYTVDAGVNCASWQNNAKFRIYLADGDGVLVHAKGGGAWLVAPQWESNSVPTSFGGWQTGSNRLKYADTFKIDPINPPGQLNLGGNWGMAFDVIQNSDTWTTTRKNWFYYMQWEYDRENRFLFGIKAGEKAGWSGYKPGRERIIDAEIHVQTTPGVWDLNTHDSFHGVFGSELRLALTYGNTPILGRSGFQSALNGELGKMDASSSPSTRTDFASNSAYVEFNRNKLWTLNIKNVVFYNRQLSPDELITA